MAKTKVEHTFCFVKSCYTALDVPTGEGFYTGRMAPLQFLTDIGPTTGTDMVEVVGGKAASLARLQAAGFAIPAAFVIPVSTVAAFGKRVAEWPAAVHQAIAGGLDTLVADSHPVAVRSSAVDEDGAGASFAGQHETVLNVSGLESVLVAIQRCLDSIGSDAAVAYRAHAGGDQASAAMAVIVQRMVEPDFAGVAFSIDPVSGDRSRVIVEAVAGLGERLVSGQVEATRYVFDRESLAVVEVHSADEAAFGEDAAREVARVVLSVDGRFGAAQDVEFAFAGGQLWLLQARPVTTAGASAGATANLPGGGWKSEFDTVSGPADVWTSANVQEVLPGVLTPLTISGYTEGGDRAYVEGYRRLKLVGKDEWPQFAAYFYNRAFLNVSAIRLIAERSLGSSGDTLDHRFLGAEHNPNARGKRSIELYRWRIRSLIPLLRLSLTASRRADRCEKAIRAMEKRIHADIPAKMSDTQIESRRSELADFSAEVFLVHLNVSGLAGAGFDLVSRFLQPIWKDETEGQMPALFSGMLGVESAQIGLDLWKLSRIAIAERMAGQLREPGFDPRAVDLAGPWKVAFSAFIARHGHRGLAEMEMSARTWRYDSAPVLAVVRSYLDLPDERSPEATLKRQERERVEVTADLARRMSAPKRLLFRKILSDGQKSVILRERTKSLAVRGIRLVDFYRETIQNRLVEGGYVSKPEDMYFLANSEISQILSGAAKGSFGEQVSRRRREYERNRHIRLPERFTGHPVPLEDEAPPAEGSRLLTGTPVSPGTITGRARVILDPTTDPPIQPGEILVAPVTDAGWTPLFALASGLVVDMGSALSHGSTVAREYGLPAVVNVRGATRTIRTGDLIAVNGTRGTVTIVEPAS